jgi:TATA-binding protein-associated factor
VLVISGPRSTLNGSLTQNEENLDLQTRSAVAVASFVEFCVHHKISQPPDKIVKNLCTFLCQDIEQTPTFAFTRKVKDGVLSFQGTTKAAPPRNGKDGGKDKGDSSKADEAAKTRLSRRGAGLAFEKLSQKFEAELLNVIPGMWQSMAGGLLSACVSGTCHCLPYVPALTSSFIYKTPSQKQITSSMSMAKMSLTL